MIRQFVSITDFTSPEQVRSFGPKLGDSILALGVGVMMSYKTLNGIETKWSKIFPANEDVAGIFINPKFFNNNIINVLHYADYDGNPLLENLVKARELSGKHLNAIQLDVPIPNAHEILEFRRMYPKIKIILQVAKPMFRVAKEDPKEMIALLGSYSDIVSSVLLDKSMGQGIGMDAKALKPFVKEIMGALPDLSIVVAGGLGPDSMDLLKPFGKILGDLSLDAQGALREPGVKTHEGPVDWHRAHAYFDIAQTMLL
jgi:hypothetical protein